MFGRRGRRRSFSRGRRRVGRVAFRGRGMRRRGLRLGHRM